MDFSSEVGELRGDPVVLPLLTTGLYTAQLVMVISYLWLQKRAELPAQGLSP